MPGLAREMMVMAYRDRQLTFDDLRGLRAEGYIRDSTLDQKDGFGPAIQRGNEERFAETYGLVLGSRWYTEFSSGRSVEKRLEFQRLLEDAGMDLFDVLLVWSTSRFGRNQAQIRTTFCLCAMASTCCRWSAFILGQNTGLAALPSGGILD